MKSPQIICKNLTLGYENKSLIENLDFEVNAGDYVFVTGENGTGKTTFIKTILKIVSPVSGTVTNTFGKIGYLPQSSNIKSDFPASVSEVVLSGIEKRGFRPFYTSEEKKIAEKNMERLHISGLKDSCFSKLSGGQKQRVLLARALCAGEEILLLDEPVSGLDATATDEMYKLIYELNKSGVTVIMISHDHKAAEKYATKILDVGLNSKKN